MKIYKKQTKIWLVAPFVLLFILLFATLSYAYAQKMWLFSVAEAPMDSSEGSINYNPPTENEIKDGQDAKQNMPEGSKGEKSDEVTRPSDGVNKKEVSVGISIADVIGSSLEVRAFTPNMIDGSGECTVFLTRNGVTLSRKSGAFIDTSTTQCGNISIPVAELSKGTWQVWVEFSAPNAQGVSERTEVTIT